MNEPDGYKSLSLSEINEILESVVTKVESELATLGLQPTDAPSVVELMRQSWLSGARYRDEVAIVTKHEPSMIEVVEEFNRIVGPLQRRDQSITLDDWVQRTMAVLYQKIVEQDKNEWEKDELGLIFAIMAQAFTLGVISEQQHWTNSITELTKEEEDEIKKRSMPEMW